MSAQPLPHVTAEEYLEIDRAAEYKSEYYDGTVYAMSGGTYNHSQLIGNLSGLLYLQLRGRPCSRNSDLRLRIPKGNSYVYPDLMITCDPPQFAGDRPDTLTNPTVVIEVLSPSTEAHDRGLKFAQYRTIESLQEYVLVSQDAPQIEIFRRQSTDQWLFTNYSGVEAIAQLESIHCAIPLGDLYTGLIPA